MMGVVDSSAMPNPFGLLHLANWERATRSCLPFACPLICQSTTQKALNPSIHDLYQSQFTSNSFLANLVALGSSLLASSCRQRLEREDHLPPVSPAKPSISLLLNRNQRATRRRKSLQRKRLGLRESQLQEPQDKEGARMRRMEQVEGL